MSLSQEQIRAMDQLRQRLSQLLSSIQSLKTDLERHEPLPTQLSLQQSAQLLSYNLTQFNDVFAAHRPFLTAAHAYPLPTFPGHTQEHLLGELMRKKLDPVGAEAWIDAYAATAGPEEDGVGGGGGGGGGGAMGDEQWKELWAWAGPTSNGIVRDMLEEDAFTDDFTKAEREGGIENVVTGLRRKLDGGEEDDEEDGEDGKMVEDAVPEPAKTVDGLAVDVSQPPLHIDRVLKFISTGTLPPEQIPQQSRRK